MDEFLGGRLRIYQPKKGYRAATDPVFLAASINARPGQSVLELGCGVGVASLCLGARVSGLSLYGVEYQPDYADLADKNACNNGIGLQVFQARIEALPEQLKQRPFDHVMLNPPYYFTGQVTAPEDSGKKRAHLAETSLVVWIDVALRRLKQGGTLTIIHLAERLPDILCLIGSQAGDIHIKPLAPRQERAAKRVIVSSRKARKGAATLHAPLVVHQGEMHQRDEGSFTPEAEMILRHSQGLKF